MHPSYLFDVEDFGFSVVVKYAFYATKIYGIIVYIIFFIN